MKKYWFTFGQIHTHSVNGVTFDKGDVEIDTEREVVLTMDEVAKLAGVDVSNLKIKK